MRVAVAPWTSAALVALVASGCPSASGTCARNSDCAAGSHCSAGACVTDCTPATVADDCDPGQLCNTFGMCVGGPLDAGLDGGAPLDAPVALDAGTERDAREPDDAGGPLDAGALDDAPDAAALDAPDAYVECRTAGDCDDGNACNGAEICSIAGLCQPGDPPGGNPSCTAAGGAAGVCRGGTCSARCTTSAFGAPARIAELATDAGQLDGRLSPDELTIYYGLNVGNWDLYMATRAAVGAPWSAPVAVAGVNTPGEERYPSETADGLFLYATSPAAVLGVATRASRGGTYSALVTPLPFSQAGDNRPYVLPGHNALYFDSTTRGGAGGADIFRVGRSAGTFGTPVPVLGAGVASAYTDITPVATPDELLLFFSSDRPGGLGSIDIYYATRASTADPFGAAIAATTLNTDALDYPTWISADGCELHFTRARTPPDGIRDLYVATRTP